MGDSDVLDLGGPRSTYNSGFSLSKYSSSFSAAGTVLSATSALKSGLDTASAYEDSAAALRNKVKYLQAQNQWEVALQNQTLKFELAKMNAEKTIELASLKRQGALTLGQGKARLGKSGVAMEGSPTSALDDIVAQADLARRQKEATTQIETEALIWNVSAEQAAARINLAYQVSDLEKQARRMEDAADDALMGTWVGAGSTFLGSFGG